MRRLEATADITASPSPPAALRIGARFLLAAELGEFALPARGTTRRADGLWQHSCFELFVRLPGAAAYAEVNVAPSTEWAAYRFSGRRAGMRPIDAGWQADIVQAASTSLLTIGVSLPLAALLDAPPHGVLEVGLAAVLESRAGALTYWALVHPDAARPDFHHPGSFVHAIRY